MFLDVDEKFGTLIKDQQHFKDQLLSLQQCTGNRDDHHQWARNLRFITPAPPLAVTQGPLTIACPTQETTDQQGAQGAEESSQSSGEDCLCNTWPSFYGRENEESLRITPPGWCPDCSHYVAVSWCWQFGDAAQGAVSSTVDKYRMDIGGISRDCKAPAYILSRAIAFAASKSQCFIWIDKECIDQDDRNDQEVGIQSMDLVYQRSAYPLGLLQSYFDRQAHLDVLDALIQGQPIKADQMLDLLNVLTIIEQDKWFSRAWILQESVSSGFEMTLLARHEPGLSKSVHLGTIPGEVEISINEFVSALAWAEQCINDAGKLLDSVTETKLRSVATKLWTFNPLHVPTIEGSDRLTAWNEVYDDPDFRQTCNAAQALTFLSRRQNSRIPDRLAIMGNLCDYRVRLDTTKVEALRYDFSICAFALAILNGDLSLSFPKSNDGSSSADHVAYSWGPQHHRKLQDLAYYEDDDDIVRIAPAKLMKGGGLLVRGWLWKVDNKVSLLRSYSGPQDATLHKSPEIMWNIIRDLMRQQLVDLADILWDCFSMTYFGTFDDLIRHPKPPKIPRSVLDVLEPGSGNLIFHQEDWVQGDDDYTAFFVSWPQKEQELQLKLSERPYERSRWLWESAGKNRSLPVARLVNQIESSSKHQHANENKHSFKSTSHAATSKVLHPSAVFDLDEAPNLIPASPLNQQHDCYVFTPATILDSRLARSQRRGDPFSWIVHPPSPYGFERDPETGNRILKGATTCRGYWKVPENAGEPEEFVLF